MLAKKGYEREREEYLLKDRRNVGSRIWKIMMLLLVTEMAAWPSDLDFSAVLQVERCGYLCRAVVVKIESAVAAAKHAGRQIF